jgi:phosphoribosylformylglycinamidine cyclo-ligase
VPQHPSQTPLSYQQAGVDIQAGDSLVERIKPLAKATLRSEVIAGIGGFGALFDIGQRYRHPVLVSGTDGVGTKLRLAFELNRHATVGIDLVAMSVNDILVQGAEPLFFLDYFACGKLDVDTATSVVAGIADGCKQSGCALIGGETAEMPGMYPAGEYDLAGFAVGVVEKDSIIDGSSIKAGDHIIGLASSGPHSNGYSLIRKIIEVTGASLDTLLDGRSLADHIMEPTRLYVKSVLRLMKSVPIKGMAHITGGGITGNLPRTLPPTLAATVDSKSWKRPVIFDWLQQQGNVTDHEMWDVFNCGIGYTIVLSPAHTEMALAHFKSQGIEANVIGHVKRRTGDEPQVQMS